MRRTLLAVAVTSVLVASACSSSTSGSGSGGSGGTGRTTPSPSSSGPTGSSGTTPTPTGSAPSTPPSTLTQAAFLLPAQVGQGYVLATSKISRETSSGKPSKTDEFKNLGCLDIDNVNVGDNKQTDAPVGAAEFAVSNSPQRFVQLITEAPRAALAKELVAKSAQVLKQCHRPRVVLFKIAFTDTANQTTRGADGCTDAVSSDTRASAKANGQVVALELTTYLVAKGRWVSYAVGYAPLINADTLTASARAAAMCARLPS